MKHGLRVACIGKMPAGAAYVARMVLVLRRVLEAAVLDAKGKISLQDELGINCACRWERHSLLAARWLRLEMKSMTLDQRLAFSQDVAKAAESRDKAVAALKIDTDAGSILDQLYGPRAKVTELPAEGANDG